MSTIPDPRPDPRPDPTPAPRPITSRRARRTKAWLAAAGVATGLTLGSAGIAAAATSGSSTSSQRSHAPRPARVPPPPRRRAGRPPVTRATAGHGPGETLLTGTTATKAKAAAEAAEPGATVIRAETDAQGATYEVHMKKADGSDVTVKLDADFKVTATDTGFA